MILHRRKTHMGSRKIYNVQRNYKRLKVHKGLIIQIRGFTGTRCEIVNISEGGASFICNDIEKDIGEKLILDICYKKNRTLIKNLSAKITSDFPAPKSIFFIFSKKRQYGAQFVGLIYSQVMEIEKLIRNHT